jgi:hypothetical protein
LVESEIEEDAMYMTRFYKFEFTRNDVTNLLIREAKSMRLDDVDPRRSSLTVQWREDGGAVVILDPDYVRSAEDKTDAQGS